jgi:hypothetical protein
MASKCKRTDFYEYAGAGWRVEIANYRPVEENVKVFKPNYFLLMILIITKQVV